jgi:hypothetical protein
LRIASLDDDEIVFDNGVKFYTDHEQDCCERVWADFKSLETTAAMSYNFPTNPKIELVPDAGIKIEGFFIPCYDAQNGYYSSNLTLYMNGHEVDISDATKFVDWG